MNICVIIPTYNEEKTISDIIRKIKRQGIEVLIIDDGSTDNTAKIAQANSCLVIANSKNQGKGAALIKGFNYVKEKEFEAVITMDGDGQHLTEDIANFIEIASNSTHAFFIGNRMLKPSGMPFIRQLTNKFMSWFISLIIKQRIPDTQCGFRMIKTELLKRIIFSTHRFETETEILIKTSRLGYKIISIPIQTVYLHEKSRINPMIDTIRFIRFVINDIFNNKVR
jgi:glycosyltransferase involved in cell wall biosynthesis